LDRQRAIEIIKEGAGRQFDPKVVQAFLTLMAQEEAASSEQAKNERPDVPGPHES
jgi:HD-GYP domain-containing protein (c-di-GMP phosphodiesterase class II)